MDCFFTGEPSIDCAEVSGFMGLYAANFQTCGEYWFTSSVKRYFESLTDSEHLKVICASESIRASNRGEIILWKLSATPSITSLDNPAIVQKDIDTFINYTINHSEKFGSILNLVADKTGKSSPFAEVEISYRDALAIKCSDMDELMEWAATLRSNELIQGYDLTIRAEGMGQFDSKQSCKVQLTPLGWQKVIESRGVTNSVKVFIAMAFKDSPDRALIQKSIELACLKNGFEAQTVDATEFLGRINDQIIAMINSSKFVVAEFTKNNPGVYYEAGYAQGLGLPVIYTVKETDLPDLHFDTNQINHIVWQTEAELQERLETRIRATIFNRKET